MNLDVALLVGTACRYSFSCRYRFASMYSFVFRYSLTCMYSSACRYSFAYRYSYACGYIFTYGYRSAFIFSNACRYNLPSNLSVPTLLSLVVPVFSHWEGEGVAVPLIGILVELGRLSHPSLLPSPDKLFCCLTVDITQLSPSSVCFDKSQKY